MNDAIEIGFFHHKVGCETTMKNPSWVFIDGEFFSADDAKISVFDHGLLYGDGIYEGLRCYEGLVFQMNEHLERLFRSAKSLYLDIPYSRDQISQFIITTIRKNELRNAYIRLLVTRGRGPIGPDPRICQNPSVIIIVENLPVVHGSNAASKGISVMIASTRRDAIDATSHEIKSLNYLNSIQAKSEAIQYRADDAILLDTRGFVSESPICNVFLVSSGILATPQASNGILHGITRKNVIEIARELGMAVQERDITPYELIHADEVFLTGTHAEIVPVVKVNNLPIGIGEPGPTTLELIARYRRRTTDPHFGVKID